MKKTKKKAVKKKKVVMEMDQLMIQEIGPVAGMSGFSNSHVTSVYADSTVVKSPEVVYRGSIHSRNRLISEEYLLNFGLKRANMAMLMGVNNYRISYVLHSLASRKYKESLENLIKLPKPKMLNEPIGPVIRSRRSTREFSGKTSSFEDLATLLFHAQGVTGKLTVRDLEFPTTLDDGKYLELRAAPSGGGLFPISIYQYLSNCI